MKRKSTSRQPTRKEKPARPVTEDLLESIEGNYESVIRHSYYDVSRGVAEEYGQELAPPPDVESESPKPVPVAISYLTIKKSAKANEDIGGLK